MLDRAREIERMLVASVYTTAQLDVFGIGQSAVVRLEPAELQKSARTAATASGTRERAATAVARPHLTAHERGYVSRPAGHQPGGSLRPTRSFLRQLRELPLLQFRHQE